MPDDNPLNIGETDPSAFEFFRPVQALKNAKTLLSVLNAKEVPIYAGCDAPIVDESIAVAYWPGHGKDGLGDVGSQYDMCVALC